jgi:hypothetical protein
VQLLLRQVEAAERAGVDAEEVDGRDALESFEQVGSGDPAAAPR